jgi:hypothetical protein
MKQEKSVPIQKGPIRDDQPNYKNMTVDQRAMQDMHDRQLRRKGSTMEFISVMKRK